MKTNTIIIGVIKQLNPYEKQFGKQYPPVFFNLAIPLLGIGIIDKFTKVSHQVTHKYAKHLMYTDIITTLFVISKD